MRKRYKVILNVEITDPDTPYPAGGDYTHLTRLEGIVRNLLRHNPQLESDVVTVSLDKVIDKGEITE